MQDNESPKCWECLKCGWQSLGSSLDLPAVVCLCGAGVGTWHVSSVRRTIGQHFHGINCPKVIHEGDGFLHSPDDDSPYSVDGVIYCGRCHMAL